MQKNGFFGVGCLNMKNSMNYGTLFRTAQIFEADLIFMIGKRFKKQASDTMKSWRHIPTFEYETFEQFVNCLPIDCKLIGIEMAENATAIKDFKHPKRAIYLLGAEDSGLSSEAIKACDEIIYLPGERSLNVAVAGSIVLFDRIINAN